MAGTAKEYAEALFALSLERERKDEYARQAELVRACFNDSPKLAELLSSPEISLEERYGVIDGAFGGLYEDIVNFLRILTKKNRIRLIPDILLEYERLYNESERVITARVTSAQELSAEEKERLNEALERRFKATVVCSYALDQTLIGGFKVEADGVLIDGSVKKKLLALKDVIKK